MYWIIDRIIDDIAVLENNETKEKKELKTSLLPHNIHEGAVIIKKGNTYLLDNAKEEELRISITERFKRLRNNS